MSRKSFHWLAVGYSLVHSLGYGAPDSSLPLSDYLSQVKKGNQGYQGSQTSGDGAKLRSQEGDTLTAFQAFASAQYFLDESPTPIPSIFGNRTENHSYELGVSKQTDFGMMGKLSYKFSHTMINGISPLIIAQFGPTTNYYNASPVLELSQSFLKNGFGSETKAQTEAMQSSALANSHAENYRMKVIEAEAEIAYWRLALARDALKVQKDSVERANKIREWNTKRLKLHLNDESDLYQSEAAWKLRTLELQSVMDENRTASLNFNSLRGLDSSEVKEVLPSLATIDITKISLPTPSAKREDVEAAFQAQKAAAASAQLGMEKHKPDLKLYTSLALNGRDASLGSAFSESVGTTQPVVIVGAKFSIPLDFGTVSDVQQGYQQETKGTELKYQRKVFEQGKEWNDVRAKYDEAKQRLDLAQQIEDIQRRKFLREKERQTRGRTTTFLVLQFEQDLATSEFSRLRLQAEILTLIAQMKTFQAMNISSNETPTTTPTKSGGTK